MRRATISLVTFCSLENFLRGILERRGTTDYLEDPDGIHHSIDCAYYYRVYPRTRRAVSHSPQDASIPGIIILIVGKTGNWKNKKKQSPVKVNYAILYRRLYHFQARLSDSYHLLLLLSKGTLLKSFNCGPDCRIEIGGTYEILQAGEPHGFP